MNKLTKKKEPIGSSLFGSGVAVGGFGQASIISNRVPLLPLLYKVCEYRTINIQRRTLTGVEPFI